MGRFIKMPLSTAQWHQRYQQQARWTHDLRFYIYNQVNLSQANKILDVGCGTGVLESELAHFSSVQVFGLDIDYDTIYFAQHYAPKTAYTTGNCFQLPYEAGCFDISLCHFLLLWVGNALDALKELIRVTIPGGYVLALAEPDYGGRIDYPSELSQIGIWQSEALKDQGANPRMGRELKRLFSSAGLVDIEVGVLGAQWREEYVDQDLDLEWQVVRSDLNNNEAFIQQASNLHAIDKKARASHQRILFVPTFYAIGKV
jgi:ubiquinone/menaquinone biosynthesis C-methylase UbiE